MDPQFFAGPVDNEDMLFDDEILRMDEFDGEFNLLENSNGEVAGQESEKMPSDNNKTADDVEFQNEDADLVTVVPELPATLPPFVQDTNTVTESRVPLLTTIDVAADGRMYVSNNWAVLQDGMMLQLVQFAPPANFQIGIISAVDPMPRPRFPCRICEKSFGTKYMRNRHESVHAGSLICPACGVSFRHQTTLTKHRVRAHNLFNSN